MTLGRQHERIRVFLFREVIAMQVHHLGLSVGHVESVVTALQQAFGALVLPAPSNGHVLLQLGILHLALVPRSESDPPFRARGDHLALMLSPTELRVALEQLTALGWDSQDVHGRVYVRNPDQSLTLELLSS